MAIHPSIGRVHPALAWFHLIHRDYFRLIGMFFLTRLLHIPWHGGKQRQKDTMMKNIQSLAIITALGLAACSSAIAQVHPGGEKAQLHEGAQQPLKDATSAVAHIASAYTKIAPFDVNADGQFDGDERRALGQAMRDGKVEGPATRNPEGDQAAHPGIIIQRIASLYGIAFSFDKDDDDTLNEAEQAALKSAIEKGEVKRPGLGGGRPF